MQFKRECDYGISYKKTDYNHTLGINAKEPFVWSVNGNFFHLHAIETLATATYFDLLK